MKVECIEAQRNPYFVSVIFKGDKVWAFQYCHQTKKDENKQAGHFYFIEPLTGQATKQPPSETQKVMIEMLRDYFNDCGIEQYKFKDYFAGVGI